MDNTPPKTDPGFMATCMNQYGLALGYGIARTREEAESKAWAQAKIALTQANPNWKWRITTGTIKPYNIKPTDFV